MGLDGSYWVDLMLAPIVCQLLIRLDGVILLYKLILYPLSFHRLIQDGRRYVQQRLRVALRYPYHRYPGKLALEGDSTPQRSLLEGVNPLPFRFLNSL